MSQEGDASARASRDDDLPFDPDDTRDSGQPRGPGSPLSAGPASSGPSMLRLVPVIGAGGVAGSLGRYALSLAAPTPNGGVPWATLIANLTGALLLGVVTVLVVERWSNPYLRPLLGVGVLGGYTTFSTYTSETRALLAGGHGGTALAYLLLTVVGGLLAALAGIRVGRMLVPGRRLP